MSGSAITSMVSVPAAVLAAVAPAPRGLLTPSASDVAVPAERLADPVVLRAELDAAASFWGTEDRAVLAALFWYGVGQVLLAPAAAGAVTGGSLSADPAKLTLYRSGLFFTAAATSEPAASSDAAALEALMATLSQVGGQPRGVFRALAADSLATLALRFGPPEASKIYALAEELRLPVPRFGQGPDGIAVHRQSCCQLYRTPHGGLCSACPRRGPTTLR